MSDHDSTGKDELDPDEPRTPMWLPLLGGILFLLGGLFFVATSDDDSEGDQAGKAAVERVAEPVEKTQQAPQPGHEGHDHP